MYYYKNVGTIKILLLVYKKHGTTSFDWTLYVFVIDMFAG